MNRTCRDGFSKSVLISTLGPVLVMMLSLGCCCTSWHFSKKGTYAETSTEEEMERKALKVQKITKKRVMEDEESLKKTIKETLKTYFD